MNITTPHATSRHPTTPFVLMWGRSLAAESPYCAFKNKIQRVQTVFSPYSRMILCAGRPSCGADTDSAEEIRWVCLALWQHLFHNIPPAFNWHKGWISLLPKSDVTRKNTGNKTATLPAEHWNTMVQTADEVLDKQQFCSENQLDT